MKVIFNNYIPFKGFLAINLFGVIFVRKREGGINSISPISLNHEAIHTEQMKELGYIFFYLWYLIELAIKYIKYKDSDTAYYSISFEREAYGNQDKLSYNKTRKRYSWVKYINIKTK